MRKFYKAVLPALAFLALGGCAGPSTRILPPSRGTADSEMLEEIPVVEEANPYYLWESLIILTKEPRFSGSSGESEAARYMQQLLEDYGYDVEHRQVRSGTNDSAVIGSSLIAVKTAPSPDADILVISTHHDSAKGSPGACDNASGAAAFLEIARLLSGIPTDTEVRFLSFAGHEQENFCSRQYVESLTKRERERERMVGVINLDTLGYLNDDEMMLGSLDGRPTMLGDMLRDAFREIFGESWNYGKYTGGEGSVFFQGQIPAVTITQKYRVPEEGTSLDNIGTVDIEKVSNVVDAVCRVASEVMSTDTPSMTAKAHYYNNLRDYIYVQEKDEVFLFGESPQKVMSRIGVAGRLAATNTDSSGKQIIKYQFPMKWFGVDQMIPSNYYFVDGKLDTINLDADAAGVDFEDMKERLEDTYGEAVGESIGPNGTEYNWADPVYRSLFALIPENDGFDVEIREYAPEMTVLAEMRMDGTVTEGTADERCEELFKLWRRLLPEEAQGHVNRLIFFSDGLGGEQLWLSSEKAHGMAGWDLGIDVNDALLSIDGSRDKNRAVTMLVRLYGQLLEVSQKERYGEPFAKQFLREPDFGASFEMFVFAGKPQETPETFHERVNFFYEFEELQRFRNQVREELHLQTEVSYAGED